jgi:hypothetical protein
MIRVVLSARQTTQCGGIGSLESILGLLISLKIRALSEDLRYLYNEDYHQCCGSGMFIPDPDFFPSQIPQ